MNKKPIKKIEVPLGFEMQPGEIYELKCGLSCRDGTVLPVNSLLIVLHKSKETPYGEIGPYGYNLICKAENGITTWATAENCLYRGLIRYIDSVN